MDGPHFVYSKLDSFLLGFGDPSNVFICFDPLKIQRQERHPKCLYLAMHMLLIVDMLFASWWRTIYSWLYITFLLSTRFNAIMYLKHDDILMPLFHLRSHFLHFLLLDIKFGQFYIRLTYDTDDLADINIYSLKNICVKQKRR